MNVDASPDGKWITFDILGDIYVMPISGGKATMISDDRSWDVQPVFSPDGNWISYTTDKSGEDNIWIMKPDGSDKKQITKETDRLPNDAVWHPTEPFLIVKKHYRNTRSLGAGEIWMYHLDGGNGVQLVKKPNFTANAGEPEITPDGKFVYFSRATAFDYNKDPNRTIYWIERYNVEEGKIDQTIRRQGGAIRPKVSPDGNTLTYIRRERLKTVLYQKDLKTNREMKIFEDMDHDQQEAWAVFGTYPKYDWLNKKELVMAHKGKIVKFDIQSKKITQIPFEVTASKQMSNTVLYKQTLPEVETTKVLRWAQSYGKVILFSALGQIYKKNGNKKPVKLMNSKQKEYMFAIDKNAKKIAYVTWNDIDKGAVYTADVNGRSQRKITKIAEQFANPVFSNNGRMIAFLRGQNINTISNLGSEPKFDVVLYDGKRLRKVTEVNSRYANSRMPALYFGPKDNRLYMMVNHSGNRVLKSMNLEGFDEKVHLSSKYAEEIVPSPDFKYVAYKYLHKIYVTPFVQMGQEIKLGSKSGQTPVVELSGESGDYIGWTSNSKTVYWTQGVNFVSSSMNGLFEKDHKVELSKTDISFQYKTAKPKGTIAFTNARVITMEGDQVLEKATVIVVDNKISEIGEAGTTIPKGAKVVDLNGKTIMPGLVDVHAHMHYNTLDVNPDQQWPYIANLAYGVTAAHDPSASTQTVFAQSEMIKAGIMEGPRVYSTGFILYGAENTSKAVVTKYDDAKQHLQRLKDVGAFSVKSYNQLPRKNRQMIIKAGHELKMHIYPEGGSTHNYNMTMIADGHTGVEHNLPIAEVYKDVVNFVAFSGSGLTPTLVVNYGGMSGENYWYQTTNVWDDKKLLTFHPRTNIDSRSRRVTKAPLEEYYHIKVAEALKKFHDAGGKVQLGAHGQLQGLAAHWELWMVAQGGMKNIDVLKVGTIYGAQYLGLDDNFGSIKVGKFADFIILDKNPLDDIKNTNTINQVMVNGVLYDGNTMDQVYPKQVKRKPYHFSDGAGLSQDTHMDH